MASVSEPANAGSVTSTPSMSTSAVQAPRDRLAQRVLGGRRPERDDRDVRTGAGGRELDGLTHRAPAVRVELEVDPGAVQPPVGRSSISSNFGICFTNTAIRTP